MLQTIRRRLFFALFVGSLGRPAQFLWYLKLGNLPVKHLFLLLLLLLLCFLLCLLRLVQTRMQAPTMPAKNGLQSKWRLSSTG